MKKPTREERQQLQALGKRVKELQAELVVAKQLEGIDSHLGVRMLDTKLRFTRTRIEDGPDRALGEFRIGVEVMAKDAPVHIPLSITSGKTTAGFMYQIEGTGEGSVASAGVEIVTKNLTQISVGTLRYVLVPKGTKATLTLAISVRGKVGRYYEIVLYRVNYKLKTADTRYLQYMKPLRSKKFKFA
jgi:hypothetical protein